MSIISYYAQLFIFLTCKSLTLWQYSLSLWQRFVFFHVAGRKLVWRQHKQTCRRVKVTQKRDIPNRRRAPTSMDMESPPRARKVHFANYVADWWAQKTQTAPTTVDCSKQTADSDVAKRFWIYKLWAELTINVLCCDMYPYMDMKRPLTGYQISVISHSPDWWWWEREWSPPGNIRRATLKASNI